MNIGKFKLKNNLILAPMAGVSDVGFRAVCIMCGADYGVCEMVSAKALIHNSKKTIDLLTTSKYDKIKVAQIFGNEPDVMAKAVQHPALAKFDIIDINMGCPAPKIVNNSQGSALLKDIALAEQIVRACVLVTDKPITVKLRVGYNNGENVAVEFAKMCERAGAKAITIHGRTKAQGYSGQVDYDTITKVKQAVHIPVIGNGDVTDADSYEKMLKCGVDAVMIGRGAFGHPQIFADLRNKKSKKTIYYVKKHIQIDRKYFEDKTIQKELIKHFLWYAKGCKSTAKLRVEIAKQKGIDDTINLLEKNLER